ncbi:putative disease resistance protein RGA1 [Rhodamnia argentea]|uniref:Disease resistance protein RGA1 n=1 Tax=Rhodamnia argentea TaxID=178133 RepID=A0A8B8P9W6_9MYRT|nr:putative disease resistance protein RGA1 [Rhodamnia argentea]
MAESLLLSIAEGVLGKIASPALQKAIAIYSIKDQIRELNGTLTEITAVLLDAEKQRAKNRCLQLWLDGLQEVLYDAEDVLDEIECEALRKRVINRYGGIKGKVHNFFSLSNPMILRAKISKKIKEIRKALSKISIEKEQFGLTEGSVETGVPHIRSREAPYSFLNKWDVVGRGPDKQKIIEILMQSNDNLSVIPIVGMGGLGKTTLAKLVYNDDIVKEQFELLLWLCVPEDFDLKTIMEGIIKSATSQSLSNFDIEQLQTILRNTIKNKKYLLVLDDVWSNGRTCWKQLKDLLIEGAKESKIIVTTRLPEVASTMGTIQAHKLEGLPHEDAMALFEQWAFDEKEPRPDLLAIGKDIVNKSRGVPLLVKTLGSLLYAREEKQYWEHIRDSDTWQFVEAENDIMPVLQLSYDHLPLHLKRCFATFSLFPKGCVIASDNLTRLWMALGLISSTKENLEDVGVKCVKDLWKRSLLHLVEESESRSFFKVHDLIHSLAMSVAQNNCSTVDLDTAEISDRVRFVSFSSTSSERISNCDGAPPFLKKLTLKRLHAIRRSRFPPGEDDQDITKEYVKTCITKCSRLRYLDLSCGSFEELPSSICSLKQLRSLLLRENKRLKKLPDSICELQSLLQLSLHGCSELEVLPKHMERLINLRFLSITTKLESLQESGIQYLQNLQFLGIYMCPNLQVLFKGTCRLTRLRELEIGNCGRPISLPFGELTALESLAIDNCKLTLIQENKSNVSLKLRKLVISRFQQVMELLQCLNKDAFNLESFAIYECPNLMAIPEWLSNHTHLKLIRLIRCPNLCYMPLANKSLKELRIEHCGELSNRCEFRRGEDWHKIAHVPRVQIDLRNVQWTDD